MKLKWVRKSLSCLTCLFYFISQDCAYAAEISRLSMDPPSPESRFYPRDAFSIPSEWGSIQELQGNSPQLILIQDAHGRYEAQKNTALILDFLNHKKGIANLFLEGGEGKLEPERLRFFNEPQFNKAAVDLLAREAEAGGAEIFLTAQRLSFRGRAKPGREISVLGLEDPKLYLQNFEAFRKVMEARPGTEKFLETELSGIRQESGRLLEADLKAFFKEWMNYESSQDLARFLNPLAAEARKRLEVDLNNPRHQLQWPQLIRFFELKKREPKLRFDEARKELKTLSEWAKRTGMPKPFTEFLLAMSSPHGFKWGSPTKAFPPEADQPLAGGDDTQIDSPFTSLRHFWESFYEAAHPRGFAFEQFPNLAVYEGYQILQQEIDSQKLFDEINQLTGQVFEKLAKGEKEKELFERARRYFLLKKLFHLQLTRREFQELEKKVQISRKRPVILSEAKDLRIIFKTARLFYYLARKREEAMLNVILSSSAPVILSEAKNLQLDRSFPAKKRRVRMTEGNNDAGFSVVIAGGFHTEALVSALKKQGISYAVVSPHFSEIGSDEKYIGAMTGAKPKLDFDAVSAVNSALLSPPPVNVIPAPTKKKADPSSGGKAEIYVEGKLQRESKTLMQSTWMGEMQPPELTSRRAEIRSQIEKWGLSRGANLNVPRSEARAAANNPEEGEKLKALRKQLGMNQTEFGQALRPDNPYLQRAVSKWENGVNPVPAEVMEKAVELVQNKASRSEARMDTKGPLKSQDPFRLVPEIRELVDSKDAGLFADQVAQILATTESDWVRWEALQFLKKHGKQSHVPIVAGVLNSEDILLRKSALAFLKKFKGIEALPSIAERLGDNDGAVRGAAIETLRGLHMAWRYEPKIRGLLGDKSEKVQKIAQKALEDIEQHPEFKKYFEGMERVRSWIALATQLVEKKEYVEALAQIRLARGQLDKVNQVAVKNEMPLREIAFEYKRIENLLNKLPSGRSEARSNNFEDPSLFEEEEGADAYAGEINLSDLYDIFEMLERGKFSRFLYLREKILKYIKENPLERELKNLPPFEKAIPYLLEMVLENASLIEEPEEGGGSIFFQQLAEWSLREENGIDHWNALFEKFVQIFLKTGNASGLVNLKKILSIIESLPEQRPGEKQKFSNLAERLEKVIEARHRKEKDWISRSLGEIRGALAQLRIQTEPAAKQAVLTQLKPKLPSLLSFYSVLNVPDISGKLGLPVRLTEIPLQIRGINISNIEKILIEIEKVLTRLENAPGISEFPFGEIFYIPKTGKSNEENPKEELALKGDLAALARYNLKLWRQFGTHERDRKVQEVSNITGKDISLQIGKNKAFIFALEKGERAIPLTLFYQIADILSTAHFSVDVKGMRHGANSTVGMMERLLNPETLEQARYILMKEQAMNQIPLENRIHDKTSYKDLVNVLIPARGIERQLEGKSLDIFRYGMRFARLTGIPSGKIKLSKVSSIISADISKAMFRKPHFINQLEQGYTDPSITVLHAILLLLGTDRFILDGVKENPDGRPVDFKDFKAIVEIILNENRLEEARKMLSRLKGGEETTREEILKKKKIDPRTVVFLMSRLETQLNALGVTYVDFARRLHLTREHFGFLRNGKAPLDTVRLHQIVRVFTQWSEEKGHPLSFDLALDSLFQGLDQSESRSEVRSTNPTRDGVFELEDWLKKEQAAREKEGHSREERLSKRKQLNLSYYEEFHRHLPSELQQELDKENFPDQFIQEGFPDWMRRLDEAAVTKLHSFLLIFKRKGGAKYPDFEAELKTFLIKNRMIPELEGEENENTIRGVVKFISTRYSYALKLLRIWNFVVEVVPLKGIYVQKPGFFRRLESDLLLKPNLRAIIEKHFQEHPKPIQERVLWDIGAWNGWLTREFSDLFGTIIAAEPAPVRFRELEQNAAKFGWKNFILINKSIQEIQQHPELYPYSPDLILMSHMLYFLKHKVPKHEKSKEYREDEEALDWAQRTLNRDGLTLVVLNNRELYPKRGTRDHFRRFFLGRGETNPYPWRYAQYLTFHGFPVESYTPRLRLISRNPESLIALTEIMTYLLPGILRYRHTDLQRYLDRYIRDNAGKGISIFDHEVAILAAHPKPGISSQAEVIKSQPDRSQIGMVLNTLAERIRYARIANGFSEAHLKRVTGMESVPEVVDARNLQSLAEVLHVLPEWLLQGEGEPLFVGMEKSGLDFYTDIESRRAQLNISADEFSSQVGIDAGAYAFYTQGQVVPTPWVLQRLQKRLDMLELNSFRSEARAGGNAEKKFLDFIVGQFEAGKSEKEIEALLLGIRPKSISREKAELLFERAKKKSMLKDRVNEILDAKHGDEEFRAGRVEGILEDLRRETLPEIKDGIEILKAARLPRGEALSEDVKNAIASAIKVLEKQIGSTRSEARVVELETIERVFEGSDAVDKLIQLELMRLQEKKISVSLASIEEDLRSLLDRTKEGQFMKMLEAGNQPVEEIVPDFSALAKAVLFRWHFDRAGLITQAMNQTEKFIKEEFPSLTPEVRREFNFIPGPPQEGTYQITLRFPGQKNLQGNEKFLKLTLVYKPRLYQVEVFLEEKTQNLAAGQQSISTRRLGTVKTEKQASLQNGIKTLLDAAEEKHPKLRDHFSRRSETRAVKVNLHSNILDTRENFFEIMMYLRKMIGFYVLTEPDQEKWTGGLLKEFIKKAPPGTPKADSEKTAIQHALWLYTGDAIRVSYLLFRRPPETRRLSPLLKKYGLQAKASRGQVSRASRQPVPDLKITAEDIRHRSEQLKAEVQNSSILTLDQAARAVFLFSQAVRQALDAKNAAGLLPMEATLEDVFSQLRGQAPAVPVSDSHKPSVMALTRYLNALSGNKFQEPDWAGELAPQYQDSLNKIFHLLGISPPAFSEKRSEVRTDHRGGEAITRKNASEVLKPNWWIKDPKGKVGVIKQVTGSFKGKKANGQIHVVFLNEAGFQEKVAVLGAFFLLEAPETDEKQRFYLATKDEIDAYKKKLRTASREYEESKSTQIKEKEKKTAGLWHELAEWTPYDSPYWWSSQVFKTNLDQYRKNLEARRAGIYDLENASIVERKLLYELLGARLMARGPAQAASSIRVFLKQHAKNLEVKLKAILDEDGRLSAAAIEGVKEKIINQQDQTSNFSYAREWLKFRGRADKQTTVEDIRRWLDEAVPRAEQILAREIERGNIKLKIKINPRSEARGPKGLQSSALAEGRSEVRMAKRPGHAGEETSLPGTPQFRIDSILQSYSKDFILWAEDPEHLGRPNPAVSRYHFRAGETHPHKVEPPKDPSDQKGFKRFQEHELRVQKFLKAVQSIRDRAAEILSEADRMKEEAFKTNDMSGWAKAAEWHEKAEAMQRRADAFGRSTTVIVVHAPTYLFSGENRDGVYHVGRRSVVYFPVRYIDSLRLDRPRDIEKLAFFLDRAQRRIEPLEKGLKEVEAGTLPSRDVMKYVPESFEEDDRLFIRNGDFAPIFRRLDILSKRDAEEKPKREKEIERLQKGISRIEEIFNLLRAVPGRPPQKSYLPRLARWFDLLLHSYSAEGMQSPESKYDLFNQGEILSRMLEHVGRNESLPTRDELDPLARLYGILAHLQENVGQHENALRSYRAQIDVWKEIQRGPDTAPYPLQLQEQVIRAFLKLGLYDDFGRELKVYLTGHGFPRKLYRLDRQFLAHSFILIPAFEAELTAILDSQLEFSMRSKKHTPEFEQRIAALKKETAEGFKEAQKKIENGTWETETIGSFEEMPALYSVVKTAEQITLSIEVEAAAAAGKGAFQIAGFSSRGLTPRKEYHLLGERIRGYFRNGLLSKDKRNSLKLIITPGKIRLQESEAFWFESPVSKNGKLAPYTQIQASPMTHKAGYTDRQKIEDRKFLQSLLFFIQQKGLVPQKDLASFISLLPAFRSEVRKKEINAFDDLRNTVQWRSRGPQQQQSQGLLSNQTFYHPLSGNLSANISPPIRKILVTSINRILSGIEEILAKIPPRTAAITKAWKSVSEVLETASSLLSVQNSFIGIRYFFSLVLIKISKLLINSQEKFNIKLNIFSRSEALGPRELQSSASAEGRSEARAIDPRVARQVGEDLILAAPLLKEGWVVAVHGLNQFKGKLEAAQAWLRQEPAANVLAFVKKHEPEVSPANFSFSFPGKAQKQFSDLIVAAMKKIVEARSHEPTRESDKTLIDLLKTQEHFVSQEMEKVFSRSPQVYLPLEPPRVGGKKIPPERAYEIFVSSLRHERMHALADSHPSKKYLKRALSVAGNHFWGQPLFEKFYESIERYYPDLPRKSDDFAEEFWVQLFYPSLVFEDDKEKAEARQNGVDQLRGLIRGRSSQSKTIQKTFEMLDEIHGQVASKVAEDIDALDELKIWDLLGIDEPGERFIHLKTRAERGEEVVGFIKLFEELAHRAVSVEDRTGDLHFDLRTADVGQLAYLKLPGKPEALIAYSGVELEEDADFPEDEYPVTVELDPKTRKTGALYIMVDKKKQESLKLEILIHEPNELPRPLEIDSIKNIEAFPLGRLSLRATFIQGPVDSARSEARKIPAKSSLRAETFNVSDDSILAVSIQLTNKILALDLAGIEKFFALLVPEVFAPKELMNKERRAKLVSAYAQLLPGGAAVVIPAKLLLGLSEQGRQEYLSLIYEGVKGSEGRPLAKIIFAGKGAGELKEKMSVDSRVILRPKAEESPRSFAALGMTQWHKLFQIISADEMVAAQHYQNHPVSVSFTEAGDHRAMDSRIPSLLLPSDEIKNLSESQRFEYLNKLTQLQLLAAQELKQPLKGEALEIALIRLMRKLNIEFDTKSGFLSPSTGSLLAADLTQAIAASKLTSQAA